jgi:hypothetical protein
MSGPDPEAREEASVSAGFENATTRYFRRSEERMDGACLVGSFPTRLNL